MTMRMHLTIIQAPTGVFIFAGSVPVELGYVYEDAGDLAAAIQCGPGIAQKIAARNGRAFGTRTWPARADAVAAAQALGFDVT